MIGEVGFASKREAGDAEANRRIEELQKYELAKAGATTVAAALPTTLAMLLQEFFRQYAEEKLARKTIERYRELAGYLAPELLAMLLGEITALHLSREWSRLLNMGGHHRKTKQARPLSERPRDLKVPASALAALDAHSKRQDEFRTQFGPDYRADLDLILANPDGTPLRPNSVSSAPGAPTPQAAARRRGR